MQVELTGAWQDRPNLPMQQVLIDGAKGRICCCEGNRGRSNQQQAGVALTVPLLIGNGHHGSPIASEKLKRRVEAAGWHGVCRSRRYRGASVRDMQHQGLQLIFDENRELLLRYLRAHGAGDAAEDLLQELWLKLAASPPGPIASPRSYLFRAATNLMIDRRRSEAQAKRREEEWSGLADRLPGSAANDPGPDR